MHQATLRPKAAIVSKKKINNFHFFPSRSLCDQIWPWCKNGWRSTQCHNLNNLGSTCIETATYQVSRLSVYCFWTKRFFYGFTVYRHCGHVGHVTELICINYHSHSHFSFHMNFGSNSPNCFCEKQVLTLKSDQPLTKVKEWPWPLTLTQFH